MDIIFRKSWTSALLLTLMVMMPSMVLAQDLKDYSDPYNIFCGIRRGKGSFISLPCKTKETQTGTRQHRSTMGLLYCKILLTMNVSIEIVIFIWKGLLLFSAGYVWWCHMCFPKVHMECLFPRGNNGVLKSFSPQWRNTLMWCMGIPSFQTTHARKCIWMVTIIMLPYMRVMGKFSSFLTGA